MKKQFEVLTHKRISQLTYNETQAYRLSVERDMHPTTPAQVAKQYQLIHWCDNHIDDLSFSQRMLTLFDTNVETGGEK